MDLSASNVLVAPETTTEWQINEILFDGQERYLQPLVFCDHVAKLSNKVDWPTVLQADLLPSLEPGTSDTAAVSIAGPEKGVAAVSESRTSSSTNTRRDAAQSRWEQVVQRIRKSFTEVTVLLDVLQIAHRKKEPPFLTVDTVGQQVTEEAAKERDTIPYKGTTLYGKRKALGTAALTLQTYLERLQTARQEHGAGGFDPGHFQADLQKLRRYWRLKKVGNVIVGDLSPAPSSSRFRAEHSFEVKRVSDLGLNVSVPRELQQAVQIEIQIKKDDAVLFLCYPVLAADSSASHGWEARLHQAQGNLMTKELFDRLCNESVALQLQCTVSQRRIVVNLFPCVSLVIALTSSKAADTKLAKTAGMDFSYALEDVLQRLYVADLATAAPDLIRPVSASGSKRARLAGPLAYAETEANKGVPRKAFITQIVEFAQHFVVASEVRVALQSFAEQTRDPQVAFHCNSQFNTSLMDSTFAVRLSTPAYEYYGRSIVVIDVSGTRISVGVREPEQTDAAKYCADVSDLLLVLRSQAAQHLITCSETLAKVYGWGVVSSSAGFGYYEGVDDDFCSSTVLCNNEGSVTLCVKCGLLGKPAIYVQRERVVGQLGTAGSDLLSLPHRWGNSTAQFQLTDYDRMFGDSLLQKLEYIMSVFTR